MHRLDPIESARALVLDRYPDATQAWLGGSVHAGHMTATSDLDITVLLPHADVHRRSLTYAGWPVELFVHTDASLRYFVEKDRADRRPTMARLVTQSAPLLRGAGGEEIHSYCAEVLNTGPAPLTDDELRLARYFLTDLIDDLAGGGSGPVVAAIAVESWRRAADLLLASERRWTGSGKWLLREVEALDADIGTLFAGRFHCALEAALTTTTDALVELIDDVLERVGGRLRDGLYLPAVLPANVRS